MQSKWKIILICIAVLLCSPASLMATGKDEVSPATLQQMKIIENSIDHGAEPCDNFYKYACGKWESQEFTLGENSSNHFISRNNFLQAIKIMLKTKYPDKEHIRKENQSFKDKVGAFYYSCINADKFGFYEELKPGNDIEWPLVDAINGKPETNMENFDLFAFLGQLFSYGYLNFLVRASIQVASNGSFNIILRPGKEKELQDYQINGMMKVVGKTDDEDTPYFQKYRDEIRATHDQWLATNKEYNARDSKVFSYKQTKQLYPQLVKLLEVMLPNQLKEDDTVEIPNIKYIDFLTKKQWEPQELRKICNYAMAWHFGNFEDQFYGPCVGKVQSHMHLAVNYMYRQHYYPAEARTTFNDLKEKIRTYLMKFVNENYLQFNDQQLKAVKDKLARIYVSVGNVPDITDDAMVEKFYSQMPDLEINNYAKNVLLSLKQRLWEKLHCPENMECLEEVGHGTYNVVENDLVIISLSSMAPVMYAWTFDPILALSLMGVFIGHEYGHSIDTVSLMDPKLYDSLYEEFKNHPNINASIECTKQQFTEEYQRQLEVDLMGARAAYRAYNTEYKIQPSFTTIPWQQLFFLNYAQYYCHWSGVAEETREETTRTNYVAMNMDEFAKAFNCPAGSKMNPAKKCLLY